MAKKTGATDPSKEEIEFIFECFAKNLTINATLDEMQDTGFPVRGRRFMANMLKEFNVAKKVLDTQLNREIAPIIVESKKKHFLHLAELANSLLEDGLDNVEINTNERSNINGKKYVIINDHSDEAVNTKYLYASLIANIDVTIRKYSKSEVDDLFSHLLAEYPEVDDGDTNTYIKDKPFELIEILHLLARRKTFKGTCPVCEEWQ